MASRPDPHPGSAQARKECAGSQGGRSAILAALDELGSVAPTTDLPHTIDGLLSIDHVADTPGRSASGTRIVAEEDSKRLSDHDVSAIAVHA